MSNEEKWSCNTCTYVNYPAAKKCTICRSPRNSMVQDSIEYNGGMCSSQSDHHPLLILPPSPKIKEEDVPEVFQNSDIDLEHLSPPLNEGVWVCKSCSYENSLNTSWCSSCHYNKDALTLSELNNENSQYITKIPCPTDDKVSGKGSTDDKTVKGSKWMCPQCTYSNWDASKFCVMCKYSNEPTPLHEANCSETICHSSKDVTHHVSSSLNSLNISESKKCGNTKNFEKLNLNVSTISNQDSLASSSERSSDSSKEIFHTKINNPVSFASNSLINGDSSLELIDLGTQRISKNADASCPTSSRSSATCSSEINVPSNSVYSKNARDAEYRQYKKRKRSQLDRLFVKACIGVVDENYEAVMSYIANGGNVSRAITEAEANLMDRPSAFDSGFTLVHLAIRFQRKNILRLLLDPKNSSHPFKRNPSNSSPDIAELIQREIHSSLRTGKDDFSSQFFSEFNTFQLPREIYDLPPSIRKVLFSELIDENAQKELEEELAINWLQTLGKNEPSCHLYALWNRSAGDCLLDSVLQATWGVFDSKNTLRKAMSESLQKCSNIYFHRWRDWEVEQARHIGFTFNERQCFESWSVIHNLAQQPGASLEHCHIFVLSHILRRPIIVYGIKYLKNGLGESLGYAKFQGVYLPFFWDRSFCYKSPIALGYTRGHFSALVSMDTADNTDTIFGGVNQRQSYNKSINLPLIDCDGNILPIHFTATDQGKTENERREILLDWMDCHVTDDDEILVAKQHCSGKRARSVTRMLDEWLDHYTHISLSLAGYQQARSNQDDHDDDDD